MKQPSKISQNTTDSSHKAIGGYFQKYNQALKGNTQVVLLAILSVLVYFSITGLLWTIPFPHLNFLHNYNGYFNWASFLIAALMFYWYNRSALLSYLLLILLFGVAYGVTLVEASHRQGEISTRIIYAAMLCTGLFGILKMLTKRKLNVFMGILNLPLWLVRFIVKPMTNRY